ncbi:MAG: hypothetical protein IJT23_05295 [Clostridia bacterium]|nr:hypothetical protein [Clostridia bacterium]
MGFLTYLLMAVIIAFAFKSGVVYGIIASAMVLAYIIYNTIPRLQAIKAQRAFSDGDFDAVKRYGEKSYKRMNFNQRMSYAYMLIKMDESEKALDILNAYIRLRSLEPKNKFIAKRQRAFAYYKLGRYEEALRDGMDCYEAGYTTKTLYALMGMIMLVLNKDLEKTTKFCEEAYDYDENDRDIQDNVSICYYLQGDYEMAEEINGYVREENPEFLEGYYHGAQIATKQGDYKKAQELLSNIDKCNRTGMTTVSEDAVNTLKKEVDDLINKRISEAFDTPVFTLKEPVAPSEDFEGYEEDDSNGSSIYDEYNELDDDEAGESIYDELNALEKNGD